MGACASVPKSMRGEAPEPAQEEQVKAVETTTAAATEEVKVEQEESKDGETNKQSLGALFTDEDKEVAEKPKEEAAPEKPEEEAAAAAPEKEPQEENSN